MIFAVTCEAKAKGKHWEQKIRGRGGWCNWCSSGKSTSTRQNTATRHDSSDWTDSKEFERTLLQVYVILAENSDVRQPALKLNAFISHTFSRKIATTLANHIRLHYGYFMTFFTACPYLIIFYTASRHQPVKRKTSPGVIVTGTFIKFKFVWISKSKSPTCKLYTCSFFIE